MPRRYFDYDERTGEYIHTGRPTNQSSPTVRRRIAARITDRFPEPLRRALTRRYLAGEAAGKSLSEMSIDIAHVISAEEMGSTLAAYLNRARRSPGFPEPSFSLEQYMTGMITTDAEDEDEVRANARRAVGSRSRRTRAYFTGLLLRRLNRTRGNLVGGDSSFNRGIGPRRDIPTLSDGTIPAYIAQRVRVQDEAHASLGTSSARFTPRRNALGEAISSTSP
jgi:hypothetical protein